MVYISYLWRVDQHRFLFLHWKSWIFVLYTLSILFAKRREEVERGGEGSIFTEWWLKISLTSTQFPPHSSSSLAANFLFCAYRPRVYSYILVQQLLLHGLLTSFIRLDLVWLSCTWAVGRPVALWMQPTASANFFISHSQGTHDLWYTFFFLLRSGIRGRVAHLSIDIYFYTSETSI